MSDHTAENDARRYLDALAENGSFGDVLAFAYELLDQMERASAYAQADERCRRPQEGRVIPPVVTDGAE